jgi:hypothetical protein
MLSSVGPGEPFLKIVDGVQTVYDAFICNQQPSRDDFVDMAQCAIRLGKLDPVFRAGLTAMPPDILQEPEQDDVEELTALLEVVPFDSLLDNERLILNPTFGSASRMIGGADSDLISGDSLIDFKTTKDDAIDVKFLDQLLGYYLLARGERARNPNFPEIKRLGFYFARRGFLQIWPISQWVDHPEFVAVEKWFWDVLRGAPHRQAAT